MVDWDEPDDDGLMADGLSSDEGNDDEYKNVQERNDTYRRTSPSPSKASLTGCNGHHDGTKRNGNYDDIGNVFSNDDEQQDGKGQADSAIDVIYVRSRSASPTGAVTDFAGGAWATNDILDQEGRGHGAPVLKTGRKNDEGCSVAGKKRRPPTDEVGHND